MRFVNKSDGGMEKESQMRRAQIAVCLALAVALAGCSRSEDKATVTGEETVVKTVAASVQTPAKQPIETAKAAEKSPVIAPSELAASVAVPAPVVGDLGAPPLAVWKRVDEPAEEKPAAA